jgi:hypothetical protein
VHLTPQNRLGGQVTNDVHDNDITVKQIGARGADWLLNQAVPAVLLACILIFMAYREVALQPQRDQLQREAYEKIQKDGQLWYETMMEKSYEDNERWRTAILSLRGLSVQQDMREGFVLKPFPGTESTSN